MTGTSSPADTESGPMSNERAEALARRFHETYERLAPDYGYKTREASAKPWAEVPEQNKSLMIAVCSELLGEEPDEDFFDLTDAEWKIFIRIPEQGYSHRGWLDYRNRSKLEELRKRESFSDPSTWEQPTIFFDEWGALAPEEEEIEGSEEGPACWWSESTFDQAREAAERHAGEDGQLWHRRATAWGRVDEAQER